MRGSEEKGPKEKASPFSGPSQRGIIVCFEMGIPCFRVRRSTRLRARGLWGFSRLVLGLGNRRVREEPRERDFAHPPNRWMKCGPGCGCQSSKASGEPRPELASASQQGPREGPTGGGLVRGAHPTRLLWIFPPGFWHWSVRRVQRKEGEQAGQSGKKRKFIRGKREGDWPLSRTTVLPF